MTTKNTLIEIPKYVLEGNQNIPEDLKKVIDYFRDCGNKNYSVSLIGTQGSPGAIRAEKLLKERGGNPEITYIHLTNENLNSLYSFLMSQEEALVGGAEC